LRTRNPPKGLLALAALVAVVVLGAASARAQLPPSPSDAPPADRPGVRPTAPPRTPPPPPPDGRRPVSGPTASSGPSVPPPPPPDVVPPAPPAPAPPPLASADKIFGTRGVLELGGSFDFAVQVDHVNDATWFTLGLDTYAGYFVSKYFTLGLYLSVYFSQNKTDEATSWSVTPGFLAAPGVAVRLARRVFFYADLLGGLYGRKAVLNDITANRSVDLYGAVGGEVGVKVRMSGRFLVRFGVRPIYYIGKRETDTGTGSNFHSDIGWFNIMFRIGFSGFL